MKPVLRYRPDPVVLIGTFAFALVILSRLPRVLATPYAGSLDYLSVVAVHAATLTAIVLRLARVADALERQFWRRIAAGFVAWLIIDIVRPELGSSRSSVYAMLLVDAAFVGFYLFEVAAVELRPHEGPRGMTSCWSCWWRVGTTSLAAVVLYGYFSLLPAWLDRTGYDTFAPSSYLFAVFDAFLAIRFTLLLRTTRPVTWRRTYSGMVAVWAIWFVCDLLSGLSYAGHIGPVSDNVFDVLLFVPFFVLIALALARDRAANSTVPRQTSALAVVSRGGTASLFASWSIAILGIYVFNYALGFGAVSDRSARGVLVLAASGVFALGSIYRRRARPRNEHGDRMMVVSAENAAQSQRMESLGRLAGGIAHDFNNLLTAIHGYADLGADSPSDQETRELFSEIRNATRRGQELTTQLLAFSRHEEWPRSAIPMNTVVLQSRDIFLRLIGGNISLVTELDPKAGSVMGVPGQLTQVLLNLVVNARDAMPDGGTLTIRTSNIVLDSPADVASGIRGGAVDYVLLEVSDTGVGMDESTCDRAFEPFFTTRGAHGGTGLGLATVHGIVRRDGGLIHVESYPGLGTIFYVFLPRMIAAVGDAIDRSDPGLPARAASDGATILLVDDDGAVREMARRFLVGLGYRVLEACDGQDALRVVHEFRGPINMLLTDAVMPHMDGWTLSAEFSVVQPDAQIVYMSGYADGHSHGEPVAGALFLRKPFSLTDLRRLVRQALDRVNSVDTG